MAAKCQQFEFFQGDDREITVTVRNAAGALVDLTGATIVWKLLKTNRQTVWVQKSVGSGIAIKEQGAYKGQFVITLTNAETAGVSVGVQYHEADVTLGGKKSTVVYGGVDVKRSGV